MTVEEVNKKTIISEELYRKESLKCQIQLVNVLNAVWDKLDQINDNVYDAGL